MNKSVGATILWLVLVFVVKAQEQSSENDEADGEPIPYHYKYTVKDDEKELYFEKEESKDENQEVKGFYSVLLPTGRIMKVEYVVDKDSGFVPKISYEDRNPFTNENDVINEV